MIVGLLTLDLHLPASNSLKSKRQVLKSLKDRIRNNFNVSVAEVGANDLWQRAVLGIAYVANETRIVNQLLDEVKNLVVSNPSLVLIDSSLEML